MGVESYGDIVTGAGEGGMAGYQASGGNVYAAIAGAIVGGIGGLFSSKAKKQKKKAANEVKVMAERDQAVQRRDIVRQLRIARANAIASGSGESGRGGSASAGAASSVTTQGAFNLNFFDTQISSQAFINATLKKAEKYQAKADFIGSLIDSVGSMGSMGGMGGGGGGGSSGGSSGFNYDVRAGTDTPNSLSQKNNFNYNSAPVLG